MGAWRDDTFLFRQVSPQLGEHVNKFKINFEPLLADTDCSMCGEAGHENTAAILWHLLIVAAPRPSPQYWLRLG